MLVRPSLIAVLLVSASTLAGCASDQARDNQDTAFSAIRDADFSQRQPNAALPNSSDPETISDVQRVSEQWDPSSRPVSFSSGHYPSTGFGMFDPLQQGSSRDSGLSDPPELPGHEPSVRVARQDLIGTHVDKSGRTTLTLHGSGSYKYEFSDFCMYSYVGYEGDWELKGNELVMRHTSPTKTYQSLGARGSDSEIFMPGFAVRQIEDQLVIVDWKTGRAFKQQEAEASSRVTAQPQ